MVAAFIFITKTVTALSGSRHTAHGFQTRRLFAIIVGVNWFNARCFAHTVGKRYGTGLTAKRQQTGGAQTQNGNLTHDVNGELMSSHDG